MFCVNNRQEGCNYSYTLTRKGSPEGMVDFSKEIKILIT